MEGPQVREILHRRVLDPVLSRRELMQRRRFTLRYARRPPKQADGFIRCTLLARVPRNRT